MAEKKLKRLDNKKRKIEAFLELATKEFCDEQLVKKLKRDKCDDGRDSECTDKIVSSSNIDDMINEKRKQIREWRQLQLIRPKLYLTLDGITDITVSDVQHLLLFSVLGNKSSYRPNWCNLVRVAKVKNVMFITLDGVTNEDYENNADVFKNLESNFQYTVPLREQSGDTEDKYFCDELFRTTVTNSRLIKLGNEEKRKLLEKKSIKNGLNMKSEPQISDRTLLLLNAEQMVKEGYPYPKDLTLDQHQLLAKNYKYGDFVFTNDKYEPVTNSSPLYAVDCEMCLTSIKENELTRVSVVDENGTTIYDALVKPKNEIINYLTQYSGITKSMLEPVTTTLKDVQKKLRKILPANVILVGQSLCSDLRALKMFHPYVIDTSCIYNLTGIRWRKTGLKKLTEIFLNRIIQNKGALGHCSAEDAVAALDLVKLKLDQSLSFGDVSIEAVVQVLNTRDFAQIEISNNDLHKKIALTEDLFKVFHEEDKKGAVIDNDIFLKVYQSEWMEFIQCNNDKEIVNKCEAALKEHSFVWTQFHQLEELDEKATLTDKREILKKMDIRVKRIYNMVPNNTVIIVALPSSTNKKGRLFVNCKTP